MTKKDWAWVNKTATADAGKANGLNEADFHKWINQFADEFGVC